MKFSRFTMPNTPTIIILLIAVTLSGCATMSVEECHYANWETLGQTDGANGKLPGYLAKRSKNCYLNGIKPNAKLWEKGRQKGLRNYCTSSNIYNQGIHGYKLSPVCGFLSISQQNKLNKSYQEGKRIYRLEKSISNIKSDISTHKKDYEKLKSGEMLSFKTEREARERMIELNNKLRSLRKTLREKEKQLNNLRK